MSTNYSKINPDPIAVKAINAAYSTADPDSEILKAYYRRNGLSIEPPENIGCMLSQNYVDDDGQKQKLNALVMAVQSSDGTNVCLQRIYVTNNGNGRAPVTPNQKFSKVIYPGATKGGAIRLRDAIEGTIGLASSLEVAEATYEATGIPCWINVSKTLQPPDEIDRITIWSENDVSGIAQQDAVKLAIKLYIAGYSVRVIVPEESGKSWLYIFNTRGNAAVLDAVENIPYSDPNDVSTPDPSNLYADFLSATAAIDPVVAEININHFIAPVGGRMCVVSETINPVSKRLELALSGPEYLRLKYSNRPTGHKRTAADDFLQSPHRREYKGLVFAPGRTIEEYYNLFRGFSFKPEKGNCSLFWIHLYFIICRCNRNHYRYLRKWLAHLVQKPAELPGVAIVVLGRQGTGKSIFVDIIGKLLGQHYLVLTRMEQLTGRFCGHLMDLLLVCANEALWGGDKAGEGALKAMITDPDMSVEFKGKDIISVSNYKRIIITSNESWPVPMDMDDRRFLVLTVSDERKEDKPYFRALLEQMDDGGHEALLYDLLHEDLSGFDVRTKPFSPYGFGIKLSSAEPIVRWWFERLHEGISIAIVIGGQTGDTWNDTPSKENLHNNFLEFCVTHRHRSMSKPVFGKELRKLMPGCTITETRPIEHVPSNNPASIDDTYAINHRGRYHILPSLDECRKAFSRYAKVGNEIWEDAFQPNLAYDEEI